MDLINLLQNAEGPSPELDFWISVRVWEPSHHTDAEFQDDIDLVGIDGMHIEKPFTSSIDAAVQLLERVLPGHGYTIQSMENDDATVWQKGEHGFVSGEPTYQVAGATPAIALCIAILKAQLETRA